MRRAAAVLVIFLAGCAGTPVTTSLTTMPPPDLPARAELSDTPFFSQTTYYCGPAALATALVYSGVETSPNRLGKEIYTPGREGTLQTEILSGARRNGRLALPVGGMVTAFRHIAAGNPVLLLQNLGLDIYPQWHYAVLVGYDLPAGEAVLRSGETRRKQTPLETLEHTWRRSGFWGVVIAAPTGPVPLDTTLSAWLEGALALERVGRIEDAKAAYETGMAHWPDASAPRLALANVLAEHGDLKGAEAVLVDARRKSSNDAIVLNNLADVQLRQGKCEIARATASAAVAAGGKYQDVARQTLASAEACRPNG